MKPERVGLVLGIMVFVIVVLGAIVLYAFVIKPTIDSSATNNQVIGYNIAINSMITQLQQQGYVVLNIGNQSIVLAPVQNPQAAK